MQTPIDRQLFSRSRGRSNPLQKREAPATLDIWVITDPTMPSPDATQAVRLSEGPSPSFFFDVDMESQFECEKRLKKCPLFMEYFVKARIAGVPLAYEYVPT